jgi:hypothetical protein
MTGLLNVSLVKTEEDTWKLNRFDAGKNKSTDSSRLQLNTYSSFLSCSGASADYDSNTHTLTFRYKYDSGFLGGGCQKTFGTFNNCIEE